MLRKGEDGIGFMFETRTTLIKTAYTSEFSCIVNIRNNDYF